MKIGEKLTKLRKESNLTQEQFADMLHVSRQSVSKWELGTAYPDTDKLIRISKLFSCSLDYLLKDEVEQMDINKESQKDEAKKNHYVGWVLTYLSFPPLFGFIVGAFSFYHSLRKTHNKYCLILTILGFIFSLSLTVIMLYGFIKGM